MSVLLVVVVVVAVAVAAVAVGTVIIHRVSCLSDPPLSSLFPLPHATKSSHSIFQLDDDFILPR